MKTNHHEIAFSKTFSLFPLITGILIFIFFTSSVHAQQAIPDARIEVERQTDIDELSRLGRKTAEVFRPGKEDLTAPASPGDDALGQQYLLKRKTEYEPFSVFSSIALNWTDNVALTKKQPRG